MQTALQQATKPIKRKNEFDKAHFRLVEKYSYFL